MPYKDLEKAKHYQKAYRLKNKQKIKAMMKADYLLHREERLSSAKKHREKNPEYLKEYSNKYYQKNRKKILIRKKEYGIEKRAEKIEYMRKRYSQNSDKLKKQVKEYTYKKLKSDIRWKLKFSLRRRVLLALKGKSKSSPTLKLLGCSVEELRLYLESKFLPGMTWKNRGRFGWHIDHIRPCASFDLTDVEQQKQCFHYTNLQPLWARDNLSKGKKYQETP